MKHHPSNPAFQRSTESKGVDLLKNPQKTVVDDFQGHVAVFGIAHTHPHHYRKVLAVKELLVVSAVCCTAGYDLFFGMLRVLRHKCYRERICV